MKKIFVSGMVYSEGKSGTSVYIYNVVAKFCLNHRVDLLLHEGDIFPLESENLNIIRVSRKLASPIINMLWHLFILPFSRDYTQYDIVFLPAGNRRLFCRNFNNMIVTFHDLSQFHIPNKYDAFRTFYVKKIIPFFLKKVKNIVAISQSTKNDLVKFYRIDESRILVNHNGYSKNKINASSNQSESKNISEKDYFLYVARIEHPGKNHLNLLKAYAELPAEITDKFDLILPGQSWSGSETVFNFWRQMPLKNNVHFPGFVNSATMENLYKKASLYLFPSYYEGFGIPLLEAMSNGVPILCSNTPSLVEVGGEAVELLSQIASTV